MQIAAKRNPLHLAVLAALTVAVTGCNSSSNDDPSTDASLNGSLLEKVSLPVGDPNCPNGGTEINTGIDDNGNGVLDANEVDQTDYVCNGEDGVAGAELVRLATSPLGAEITGLFLNSDGSLFMNFQHPSGSNATADAAGIVYNNATIGAIVGADFNDLSGSVAAVDVPVLTSDKEVPQVAVGAYQVIGQQTQAAADGSSLGDIISADGNTVLKNSNDPDFTAVVPSGTAGEFLVYSNWEDRPGGMSRIRVSGLTDAGYGSVTPEGMLDFSGVQGTWVNCFGTLSPWGTPLTSEELYFDDTAAWFGGAVGNTPSDPRSLAAYLGYPTDGSGNWPNPYRYGYIVEVGTNGTVAAANVANVEVDKLETLGRFSHENSVVMPDGKTVFLSDDGGSVVFFKFVADTAGDLSAGTLYAGKFTQLAGVTDMSEASFAIQWVELGSAAEADIESWMAEYDGTYAEAKYITDQQVNDWAEAKLGVDLDASGSVAASPFADDRAAFFESRKAAAALGATAEFNKMEGVNINYDLASAWWNNGAADGTQAYMYMAMSTVGGAMTDGAGDVQLDNSAGEGNCGVVYRMKLIGNADGNVDVAAMVPAVVGGPYDGTRSTNRCSVNGISNPDNLLILNDGRVVIGEDTGNHQNNMVWLFRDPAI